MKHRIIFTSIAIITACQSLDQLAQSSYDDAAVFSNETLARYAVDAIYYSYGQTTSYRNDYFFYYGCNTDVEVMSYASNERNDIAKYDISPYCSYFNKTGVANFFEGNMQGIERANICIEGLKKYGDIERNKELGALYAEALVARALLYIDLMNVYGEVPARFEPVNSSTTYLPKADRDILYKQLLSDLEQAAKYLDYNDLKDAVRPGLACANALYARIALQASGYSLRPEEGKVNTGDAGTVRMSYDPELQKSVLYPKALKALKDIISNANLSLYDNFEDLWRAYCNLETGINKNDGTANEMIFCLPFSDTRGWHIARCGVPNAMYAAGGGRKHILPNLFFKYDPADSRRDVTCAIASYDEKGKANEAKVDINEVYCGKFRFDWMEKHPMDKLGNDSPDGAKYIYIRYADVLLMAAEIANELGDIDAAKSYMKPVLDRAFHNDAKVSAYLNSLATKEDFFEAVKDQRAFEFAGECLRRADLIRWGILKQAIDEAKEDLQHLKALDGPYGGMNDVLYYRYKANGIDLEYYGTNPSESGNIAEEDPSGGWYPRLQFFSKMSPLVYENLYINNPDEKMYRPLPAALITANMGALVNDYGYKQ